MKATRREHLSQPFVMSWEDVALLAGTAVASFPRQFRIEILCGDGLMRTFTSLNDFEKYGNPVSKLIRRLSIRGYLPNIEGSASLEFGADLRGNIELMIEGPEETVSKLSQVTFDCLAASRPWYGLITRANWIWIVTGLLAAYVLGALTVASLRSPASLPDTRSPRTYLLAFSVIALAILAGALLNRFRSRFFPISVFAFGDGKKEHMNRETIRTVIIAGFIVGVLASLAAAIILAT